MTTNIEIDFSDVSLFKEEIKSFNASLRTLQGNIKKFSDSINDIGTNFGAARTEFQGIKDAVQGVDVVFRGIASAMTSIAKVPNLDSQVAELGKFIAEIKTLGATGNTSAKVIASVVNSFTNLAKLQLKGVSADIQPMVDAINRIYDVAGRVGAENLSASVKQLQLLIKTMKDFSSLKGKNIEQIGLFIAKSFGTAPNVQEAEESGEKIGEAVEEGIRDATGIRSLSPLFIEIGLNIAQSIARGLASGQPSIETAIVGIGAAIGALASAGPAFSFIKGLITTFKLGRTAQQKFKNRGKPSVVAQQAKDSAQSITEIITAIGSIPTLNPADVKNFENVSKAILQIINSFTDVEERISGKGKLLGKKSGIDKLLNGIVPFITTINEVLTTIPAIDPKVASSFKDVIRTITNLLNQLSDPKFESSLNDSINQRILGGNTRLSKHLLGIRKFANILADALRSLTDLGLGGANSVRAAATAIRSIRDIITVLTDENNLKVFNDNTFTRFEKISNFFGRSTRLTKLLKGIRPFTKLLADALKNFKDIPAESTLRAAAASIESLATIVDTFSKLKISDNDFSSFEALSNFFGRSTRLTKLFKGIRPLTSLLADALNNFKKIKVNPAVLNGVALFVQGLNNILGTIARSNIDEAAAGKIANVIKKITEALAEGISSNITNKDFFKAGEGNASAYFDGFEKEAEIKSPSKRMIRAATDIFNGFKVGISSTIGKVASLGKSFFSTFFNTSKQIFTQFLSQLRSFSTQVEQKFQQITQNIRNNAQSALQGGFAALSTGGFAGFLQSNIVSLTRTFDAVIKQVGVFGDLTKAELAKAQQAILDFSAATKFGPAESAQAFLDLQKAGLAASEALKTLPQIGNFAVASNLDLTTSTQLALQTLNGFGLGIENLNQVIDAFVGGADISTAGVAELAQALGFVSPSAAALAIPLEDVTAALALLNDQAITGERAGTGLRGVLDSLAAPTAEAKATLDELGISLADQNGNFIGLEGTILEFQFAINRLREAGAGDLEIIEQLSSIGDRNAISTLLALIKDGSGALIEFEDGSKRAKSAFEEYRESLDSANKAGDIAAELSNTIDAAITSLTGSIETLIITAFQPLLNENIKPLIESLIEVVNALTKLPKPILKFAAGLTVVGTVLVTLGGILSVFTGLLLFSLIPALQLAAGVFALVFNPVSILATGTAIVTTFAVATPALLAFGAGLALIAGLLLKFYSDVKNNTGGAGDAFKGLTKNLGELSTVISDLLGSASSFFKAFIAGTNEVESAKERVFTNTSSITSFLNTLNSGVEKVKIALSELKLLFDFFTNLTSEEAGTTALTLEQQRLDIINEINSQQVKGHFNNKKAQEEERARIDALIKERDRYAAKATEIDQEGGDSERIKKFQARADELHKQILEAEANFGKNLEESTERVQEKYLIKSGDTLTAISREFGVSIQEILDANPQITDPNLIFTGDTLTIPGLDTTEVIADATELEKELEAIDKKIAARRGVERGLEPLENTVVELTKLQKITQEFSKTTLFKRLFGDDEFAIIRAVETVGTLETIFKGIAKSAKGIAKGFGTIFTGKFKNGVKQITSNISLLGFELTNLFETVTGVDISDTLQKNLQEGNLRAIFTSATSAVGNTLLTLFSNLTPYAIQGAGFVLRAFLKGLGGGVRLLGNVLGIDFINSFFAFADKSIIEPIVGKFIETLTNLFQLGAGEISLSSFIIDLLGLEDIGDKIGVVKGIEEIESAIDELKLAFSEFLTESSLDQIDFRKIADDIIYFDENVKGDVAAGVLSAIAGGIQALSDALKDIGPFVKIYLEPIGRLLGALGKEIQDVDADKIKDIAIALAIIGVASGAIALGPLLGLGAALFVIYVGANVLAEVIGPVSDFLQDMGDFVQELAEGDFEGAARELREMFFDIGEILKGVGVGTLNAFSGIFEAIGKLTGLNTQPIVEVLDALSAALSGDTKAIEDLLGKSFGQKIAEFALGITIAVETFKLGILQILDAMYDGVVGTLNKLIGTVNDITGTDIATIDGGSGLDDDIKTTQDKIDKLNNTKIIIDATVDFQETGDLNNRILDAIETGNTDVFGDFIANSLFAGVNASDIKDAIQDAVSTAEIDTSDIVSTLISGVQTGDITPEQASALIPDNLASVFGAALQSEITSQQNAANEAGTGEVSPLLLALQEQLKEDEVKQVGIDAGNNLNSGLAQGLKQSENVATDATTIAMNNVKAAINTSLETQSPSQYTFRQGQYLMEGLRNGIQTNLFMVRDAINQVTSSMYPLVESVRLVEIQITSSFANAAVMMEMNVVLMEASINRLIAALMVLATVAGAALQSVRAVTGASVSSGGTTTAGRTAGTTTTTGSTTKNDGGGGGYTDVARTLKGLVGGNSRPIGAGMGGGGNSTTISLGSVTINNANPNYQVTPNDIAKGIKLYAEQNPITRRTRNKT